MLISLFELNTPEFTMLLGALPKTFQDGATKLLHNHLKNSSNTSVVSAVVAVGNRHLLLIQKLLGWNRQFSCSLAVDRGRPDWGGHV